MKRCTKCKELKLLTEFAICKRGKNGVSSICKKCRCEYAHGRHIKNIEREHARKRKYYIEHLEECRESRRKSHAKNPEYSRQYYIQNKKKLLKQNRQWQINNPEKVKMILKKASAKIRNTLKGRLNDNISSGIYNSLRKGSKAGRHWESLVNFTIDQLKKHLEKLFTPEMNWDNYGTVWEIDHKIPIAVFSFDKPEHIDFRLCWSMKNLQPLEIKKNISKGAKLEEHFQPSLKLNVGIR